MRLKNDVGFNSISVWKLAKVSRLIVDWKRKKKIFVFFFLTLNFVLYFSVRLVLMRWNWWNERHSYVGIFSCVRIKSGWQMTHTAYQFADDGREMLSGLVMPMTLMKRREFNPFEIGCFYFDLSWNVTIS